MSFNYKDYVKDKKCLKEYESYQDRYTNSIRESDKRIIEKIGDAGVNDYMAGCSTCAYNIYCGADPVLHHATQGDMYGFRPDSSFCQRNMSVLDIIFEKIDTEPDALDIFKSWVNNE